MVRGRDIYCPLPPSTKISGHCSEMYTPPSPALAVSVSLPASLPVSGMTSGWDYTCSVGWRVHLPDTSILVPAAAILKSPSVLGSAGQTLQDRDYNPGTVPQNPGHLTTMPGLGGVPAQKKSFKLTI